ncbi:hypothetical protein SAY87_027084 [Trapa incisa]|uniref:Uncharacterized protein n=1 Tax=Trapa incisa TaxID=236973 RepID=A0AAN7JM81_9MYRT|nr:hypothetical protein SAY87_027084 [Trapa incisa]
MEESTKLSALQKAYAEIIMNISKETAYRVMASEKKRLQIQKELSAVKDEGLRLLMRLKQMLDVKTTEAEMTATSRRKKIEELEAQLNEAEDIVEELRGELRDAQTELAKLATNRSRSLNRNSFDPGPASTERIEGNPHESYCQSDYIYAYNPDFSARMMKERETELGRCSFTQKIHAFGGNIFGQLSLPGKEEHLQNKVHKGGKNDPLCTTPNLSPDQPFGMEEDPNELEVMETNGNHLQIEVPRSFQRKRKRTTRYLRCRAPVPQEKLQASSICFSKSTPNSHDDHWLSLDADQIGVQSKHPFVDNHVEPIKPCSFLDKKGKNKLILEESVMSHGKGWEKSLMFSAAMPDTGRINLSSQIEASNLADPGSEDKYNGKFLKYTFQRRRKKGKVNLSDGNSTADHNTRKMELYEHDICQETSMIDQNSESSGHSQLMEAAEQLINLSEDMMSRAAKPSES